LPLSIHDLTVPVFGRILTALDVVLQRGMAHCQAAGIDPRTLARARLIADMEPLGFQIAAVLNNSVGAVARLRGLPWSPAEAPDDLAAMRAVVSDAAASLPSVVPADLERAETREIVLPNPRGDRVFSGRDYLLILALPNAFFHAATAYDILRAQGVDLGKRDFLGPLPPRRPPA
jgi:hypothetical protein